MFVLWFFQAWATGVNMHACLIRGIYCQQTTHDKSWVVHQSSRYDNIENKESTSLKFLDKAKQGVSSRGFQGCWVQKWPLICGQTALSLCFGLILVWGKLRVNAVNSSGLNFQKYMPLPVLPQDPNRHVHVGLSMNWMHNRVGSLELVQVQWFTSWLEPTPEGPVHEWYIWWLMLR
mgnify:CR=1 FL=1